MVTNSFAAINMIHSGLLKKLSEKYNICLLSTMIGQQEIAHINEHYNMAIGLLNMGLPLETPLLRLLRRIEKTIFSIHFQIDTYRIKALKKKLFFRHLIRLADLLRFAPGLTKLVVKHLRKLIISLTARSVGLSAISNHHFHGIISSSPLDIRENSVINFLSKQKIKTLAMIISWDNLTSKGMINAEHDYVLVWNKAMADEFNRFYSLFKPKKKVCITGIPRFDIYFQDNDKFKSNADFKAEFGIPPTHKVILFATSARMHFPSQNLIIEDLIEYLQFHSSTTIIIRCHPADPIQLYDAFLKVKNLHIWHPEKSDFSYNQMFYKWLPTPNFLNSLADMLKNCDVCIQVASTIRLDAAACNKPVISIAYDGIENLPYHQSVKRLYDYSHQLPLNQLETDQIVVSKKALFSSLAAILGNKNTERNYVGKVTPLIHHSAPKSVDTILQIVEEWLH